LFFELHVRHGWFEVQKGGSTAWGGGLKRSASGLSRMPGCMAQPVFSLFSAVLIIIKKMVIGLEKYACRCYWLMVVALMALPLAFVS